MSEPGEAMEAWEFDPTSDLGDVVRLASDGLAPPSFSGHLVSTRGDALTIQLTSGAPSGDASSLYYVKGYGAFVLARCEEWPPARPGAARRMLVTLLAFPQPRTTLPSHHP
jgi:hypothetical protein